MKIVCIFLCYVVIFGQLVSSMVVTPAMGAQMRKIIEKTFHDCCLENDEEVKHFVTDCVPAPLKKYWSEHPAVEKDDHDIYIAAAIQIAYKKLMANEIHKQDDQEKLAKFCKEKVDSSKNIVGKH